MLFKRGSNLQKKKRVAPRDAWSQRVSIILRSLLRVQRFFFFFFFFTLRFFLLFSRRKIVENFVGFVEARVKTPPVDGVKRFIDLCPFRSDACKHAGNEWKGNKRRGNRREDFYAFTNSPSLSLSLSPSRACERFWNPERRRRRRRRCYCLCSRSKLQ